MWYRWGQRQRRYTTTCSRDRGCELKLQSGAHVRQQFREHGERQAGCRCDACIGQCGWRSRSMACPACVPARLSRDASIMAVYSKSTVKVCAFKKDSTSKRRWAARMASPAQGTWIGSEVVVTTAPVAFVLYCTGATIDTSLGRRRNVLLSRHRLEAINRKARPWQWLFRPELT